MGVSADGPPWLADLARRFTAFDEPQRLLERANLSPDLLRQIGIRNDGDHRPRIELHRALEQVFASEFVVDRFVFDAARVEAVDYQIRPLMELRMAFVPSRTETSSNWSGAYITANQDKRFLQVWGLWTVPANLKLPPAPFQGPPGIEYRVANWIGLDGQRRYFNSSLPQMGTTSILQADGSTRSEAWVQWFERGADDPHLVPLTLAVKPGDTVLCFVTVLGPQHVACVIINLSPPLPALQAVCATAPPMTLPDGTVAAPDIAGATAEWVVERPQVIGQATPNNFPDYGRTKFRLCLAVEGDNANLSSLFGGVAQNLSGARPIRMFDVLPNPARTRYISMPDKVDDITVRVHYGGF
jgi:Peptidase A4 family